MFQLLFLILRLCFICLTILKTKTYDTVGICPKSYRKITETGVILIVLTDTYIAAYIYGFVKALQLKRDRDKQVLWIRSARFALKGALVLYVLFVFI